MDAASLTFIIAAGSVMLFGLGPAGRTDLLSSLKPGAAEGDASA